ncbi:MAG: MAE_28990/MAE_18760 family HEPN-like nuclease [Desulforhopalus sp.]
MEEFEKRKQEIHVYIEFLNFTESSPEIFENAARDVNNLKLLRKVLLANTYLLMYNLVESSIRNSIQEIYDHFQQESVSFDNLPNRLKEIILKNLKQHNSSKFIQGINNLATDVVHKTFDSEKIASGNLDAKEIRRIAKQYGFSCDTEYDTCKNGTKLLEVKNKRNDLAHGILSFSECGKDISVTDINEAFAEVSAYLFTIINNVKKYIDDKNYLV